MTVLRRLLAEATTASYPLAYDVEYPEQLSRRLIFVKWLLAIPHFIIAYALGIAGAVVTFIAFFAILMTKRYPRGLFDFVVNLNRWSANLAAYMFLMRDEYPPFSWERDRYPVTYDVEYPEELSRWLIFVKWLLLIPHIIVLSFLFVGMFLALVAAWFAILFTGRFPGSLFHFVVGVLRWQYRVSAYANLMTDEYPPLPYPPLPGWAWATLFLAPSIIVFGAFVFYPLGKSAYLGFYQSNPFGTRQIYVGFDQYTDVLTSSSFLSSLLVTATFTLYTVVPALVIGTFLAVLANQKLPGIAIFRTIFASTMAASVAITAVLWMVLLDPSVGMLNEILQRAPDAVDWLLGWVGLSFFDVPKPPEVNWLGDGGWAVGEREGALAPFVAWFADPNWALISVSMATVWMNIGLFTIIVLAGLQTIPEELYESARIDGAGRWAQFRHVTLPMLSPTLFFASVVGVIFAFQAFGQIDILTQGGPVDASNVILYSIYQEGFENFRVGAASVQAIALFCIMLVLTLLQFRLLERRVFYR